MGLEIRKNNGKPVKNWYGSFKDSTGKRKVISLSEPLPDKIPTSLKLKGTLAFEQSRERALIELRNYQNEERSKGRSDHLTQKLIESKTGTQFRELQITDLLSVEIRGKRSKDWERWQHTTINRFVDWCISNKINSIFEINQDTAEKYISELSYPDTNGKIKTSKTIRENKNCLSMVFNQVLPSGCNNPFKSIRVYTEEGKETIHRTPLTPEQLETLLESCRNDSFIYPLIVTAVCTGLRRGDVCRLKWCDVDMSNGSLSIKTSKTGARVIIPILPLLQSVLESALTERNESDVYVFPEAQIMIETNPCGISYRIKKAFVKAFRKPDIATLSSSRVSEVKPLCDVLGNVLNALEVIGMNDNKKTKIKMILRLYSTGMSYRDIEKTTGISRGVISDYLHEVQRKTDIYFLPEINQTTKKERIKDITRRSRGDNMRYASIFDMHSLRTTFVTLAISGGLPVEKVIAITGHSTVKTAMTYYFKPKGTDYRQELLSALPDCLTS